MARSRRVGHAHPRLCNDAPAPSFGVAARFVTEGVVSRSLGEASVTRASVVLELFQRFAGRFSARLHEPELFQLVQEMRRSRSQKASSVSRETAQSFAPGVSARLDDPEVAVHATMTSRSQKALAHVWWLASTMALCPRHWIVHEVEGFAALPRR